MRSLRLAVMALALLFVGGLSACGFSPLYGANGVASGLSEIRVETGRERIDFRLQEALLDGMGARHAAGPYTLRATASVESEPFGVGADAIARRYSVRVTVGWQVLRDGNVDPVLTGTARSDVSYDVPAGVFGALAAEADAEDRAVSAAADRLIAQLARTMRERETW